MVEGVGLIEKSSKSSAQSVLLYLGFMIVGLILSWAILRLATSISKVETNTPLRAVNIIGLQSLVFSVFYFIFIILSKILPLSLAYIFY